MTTVAYSETKNDNAKEACRRKLLEEKDRIVEFLKQAKDAVPVAKVAKALGMNTRRPSFVAGYFKKTLSTWMVYENGHKGFYIDLHPHIRIRYR